MTSRTEPLADGARIEPEEPIAAPEPIEQAVRPPSPEELEKAERTARLRLRRRLMLWGIVVSILPLLLAAKLLSMTFIGAQAVRQYEEGDYEGSMNTSELLRFANVIEVWKADYNVGTNQLQLGLLPEAEASLRVALASASPQEACPVRANLALAIERQGDQLEEAGDREGAVARWEEARLVLAEADPSCQQSSSSQSSEQSQERIEEKIDPSQDGEGGEQGQGGEDPEQQGPQESQEQQGQEQTLEEQMQENQQQRQDDLDGDGQGGGGHDDYPTPW